MQTREFIGLIKRTVVPGLVLAAMLVGGGAFSPSAFGEEPPSAPEKLAYEAAFLRFQDGLYPLAEREFGDFLGKYTNSILRPNAILYVARARLGQSKVNDAIELLQKSAAGAGGLRSEYLFWTAKARLAAGDTASAADGFATVARDFPSSPVRLEAAYDEAEVHSRTGDWPGVIRLLQQTNGPFELAAAQDAKSEFAARGWLLLGEALLHENRLDEGEKRILGLDPVILTLDDLRWRRQYLLCRFRLAAGRGQAALDASTNLFALDSDAPHRAASVFLQGQILEKLDRAAEALTVYGSNLAETLPPEAQQQAMERIIYLTVALNPWPQAARALETNIVQRQPLAPGQDLARVSLGELYLKAFTSPGGLGTVSNAPAGAETNLTGTNLLAGALTNFTLVISNFPHSSVLAEAHLDRGWCEWFSTNMPAAISNNLAAAKADFEDAAIHLPLPRERAVARLKLADTQFLTKDYVNAILNYRLVLTNTMPEVTNSVFDLALYQLAEADLRRGDEAGAREAGEAVEKILRWYPGSYFGDSGSLLMGEDSMRKYDYTNACGVFTSLLARSPQTPLRPEVELAIAQTYDYRGQTNEAITHYKDWLTHHTGDVLMPDVQFHLALTEGKAGLTNEALMGLTNFVLRFPTNRLASWALNWVADYYYNQSDWSQAEKNYQELFQRHPDAGDLAFQARFWAGKSALANQETKDATDYFNKLVEYDTNAPAALVARSYLALGDIYFQQFQASQTNLEVLSAAIAAASRCTNGAPTNAIAVEALGRLGDYHKGWADKSTNTYKYARQMYETITNFPAGSISVSARSQAEFGLGVIAEKEQKLPLPPEQKEQKLQLALSHYCNVIYNDPADFDPYWLEQAGVAAAQIYEDQQDWKDAISVYQRVLRYLPALRPLLEKKIAAAEARSRDAAKK